MYLYYTSFLVVWQVIFFMKKKESFLYFQEKETKT